MNRRLLLVALLVSSTAFAQGIGIVFGPGPGMTPGSGAARGPYPAPRSIATASVQGFYPATVDKYAMTCYAAWVKQTGNDWSPSARRNTILSEIDSFPGSLSNTIVHLQYHDDGSTANALADCAFGFFCPWGGTLSGTNCINPPNCPVGQGPNAEGECVPV